MDQSLGKEKPMKKLLFLEYKFRDFTDEELLMPQATGIISVFERLKKT